LSAAEIRLPRPEEIDRLCDLYEACIPASERKPTAALRAMAGDPAYDLLAADQGGSILGFAVLRRLAAGIAVLEYMGVAEAARSAGIGRRLFEAAAAGGTLLVEVESDAEPGPDLEDRHRRKTFYRRLGCRELAGVDYRMPQLGDEPPPPMRLLLHGEAPPAVARDEAVGWLTAIYRDVYGRPAEDPALVAMIAPLPDRIPLV
jgi:GNAT superfamily N-acetyltransferase